MLPALIVTVLIPYLYISYVLSFQAAEMREKTQQATSESRDLSIPVELKNKCHIIYCVLNIYQDIEERKKCNDRNVKSIITIILKYLE